MAELIGDEKVAADLLPVIQKRGGDWYAYQNHDLGHPDVGHLQLLQCGKGCTFPEPPEKMPDSHLGIGWRYLLVGKVDLETGEVVALQENS